MYDHALNSNQMIPPLSDRKKHQSIRTSNPCTYLLMLLSVSFYEYEQSKKRRNQSAVLCCAVKIISLTAMPVHLRCNISILFRIAEMSGFINHFNLIL